MTPADVMLATPLVVLPGVQALYALESVMDIDSICFDEEPHNPEPLLGLRMALVANEHIDVERSRSIRYWYWNDREFEQAASIKVHGSSPIMITSHAGRGERDYTKRFVLIRKAYFDLEDALRKAYTPPQQHWMDVAPLLTDIPELDTFYTGEPIQMNT